MKASKQSFRKHHLCFTLKSVSNTKPQYLSFFKPKYRVETKNFELGFFIVTSRTDNHKWIVFFDKIICFKNESCRIRRRSLFTVPKVKWNNREKQIFLFTNIISYHFELQYIFWESNFLVASEKNSSGCFYNLSIIDVVNFSFFFLPKT